MKRLLMPVLLSAIIAFGDLSFVSNPAINFISAGNWQVTFELSEAADVEVAIIDTSDWSIVRHLAAGVLGANAPAPLVQNALQQTLTWDGKDDLGNTVSTANQNISVRVRAGMSVSLDQMAGGSPYGFSGINGLLLDNDGKAYILGMAGYNDFSALRQYDAQGNYLKTLFPYAANHPMNDISGFGVNNWLNGKISPKTTRVFAPDISSSLLSGNNKYSYITMCSRLVGLDSAGNILAAGLGSNKIMRVTRDGAKVDAGNEAAFVTSPAYLVYTIGGPLCATLSRNGKCVYLSGIYYNTNSNTRTLTDVIAPDTGFWRDGRVFRVDLTTGAAAPLISLTGVPTTVGARMPVIGPLNTEPGGAGYAAIHGTTVDGSRIFICDRLNQRIGVYDTSGTYITGVPVKDPDAVAVNGNTGELYVVSRNNSVSSFTVGFVKLYKFSAWNNSPAVVCSTLITTTVASNYEGAFVSLGLSGVKPVIWVAYRTFGVKVFQDDGGGFTVIKDFQAEGGDGNLGFDRPAVDRKSDKLYFNDSWDGLYQVEDWSNPKVTPCSTATRRLYAGDVTVSPDGELYLRENTIYMPYEGPITRYTLDHVHVPIPYANTNANQVINHIWSRKETLAGYGDKGIAVSTDKRTAYVAMVDVNHAYILNSYYIGVLADSGSPSWGQEKIDTILKPFCPKGGGIRFDAKGNLYLGVPVRSPDHQIPSGFQTDWGYGMGVGSIVRFPAGVKGSVTWDPVVVTGADKTYPQGLAPMSNDGGSDCCCRSPRFDVDLYGRLYIPNAITQKVAVADNNGNTIADFGEYGNWDSWGGNSPVPTTDVPFAWPTGAAASDNYIYVTDMINTRVVRVRMDYAINSMPLSTSARVAMPQEVMQLTASPNPFIPESRVQWVLPRASRVTLGVFDISGQLVKTLISSEMSAGVHTVSWDATDRNQAKVAAGIYVYRMSVNGKTMLRKTILSK
jgi:flagellar hook assembly protein FlgD